MRHSHQAGNYLSSEALLRHKKAIEDLKRMFDGNGRKLATFFGISHSAWYNWERGYHDVKPSFARMVEQKTDGKIKARDLLGV